MSLKNNILFFGVMLMLVICVAAAQLQDNLNEDGDDQVIVEQLNDDAAVDANDDRSKRTLGLLLGVGRFARHHGGGGWGGYGGYYPSYYGGWWGGYGGYGGGYGHHHHHHGHHHHGGYGYYGK